MQPELIEKLTQCLMDIALFTEHTSGLKLRSYQRQAAAAIHDSVIHQRGDTIVVIFPRQSGKNELQAQIEAYLLLLLSQAKDRGAEMVKVSPTWKPQALNAMRRLERVLSRNFTTANRWRKESGYIYCLGEARLTFLSAAPAANVVGATASALLECDEAQDVSIEKWDREINPMAASTNATRVFWGTAWTADTLLAREERLARQAEQADGRRRVFRADADLVGVEAPAYRKFVDGEIAKLGRMHPFVRTQFFSEEIDAQASLFTPERQALMHGGHPWQESPAPDAPYAFLIDVAGAAAMSSPTGKGKRARIAGGGSMPLPLDWGVAGGASGAPGGGRDSTALTIVSVDCDTLASLQAPVYRVVHRRLWVGAAQPELFAAINTLAENWRPRYLVVDATGLGEGLASFLARQHAGVIPFKFTLQSKSRLAWTWLSIIETGRYREYAVGDDAGGDGGGTPGGLQRLFFTQLNHIQSEILPGPGRLLRWSVPEGRRDASGALVHDDLVMSAALVAQLEDRPWGNAEAIIVPGRDPIGELDGYEWVGSFEG